MLTHLILHGVEAPKALRESGGQGARAVAYQGTGIVVQVTDRAAHRDGVFGRHLVRIARTRGSRYAVEFTGFGSGPPQLEAILRYVDHLDGEHADRELVGLFVGHAIGGVVPHQGYIIVQYAAAARIGTVDHGAGPVGRGIDGGPGWGEVNRGDPGVLPAAAPHLELHEHPGGIVIEGPALDAPGIIPAYIELHVHRLGGGVDVLQDDLVHQYIVRRQVTYQKEGTQ